MLNTFDDLLIANSMMIASYDAYMDLFANEDEAMLRKISNSKHATNVAKVAARRCIK